VVNDRAYVAEHLAGMTIIEVAATPTPTPTGTQHPVWHTVFLPFLDKASVESLGCRG
jgi:hypothetical protein